MVTLNGSNASLWTFVYYAWGQGANFGHARLYQNFLKTKRDLKTINRINLKQQIQHGTINK